MTSLVKINGDMMVGLPVTLADGTSFIAPVMVMVDSTGTVAADLGRYNTSQPVFTNGNTGDLQIDSRGNLRVTLHVTDSSTSVIAAGRVIVGPNMLTGTDRSIATSTASAQLMAANAVRTGFEIVNDTAIDVWINYGATAVATAGSGNRKIAAGTSFRSADGGFVYSGAINIIAASGTPAITAREY